MTQGFDEFYGSLELQCLNTQEVGELCFEAGAASRQAEIDELQRKLDYSERLRSNQFEHLKEITTQRDMAQRVNRELQKQIDEALDYVFGLYCTGDLDTERLENILKGDSNE